MNKKVNFSNILNHIKKIRHINCVKIINISLNFIHNISIDLFGGGNINHAQITLPNEGATSVEVLLRIQELESQYEYFFGIGFSYTFGSSQVPYFNPRMDDWGW